MRLINTSLLFSFRKAQLSFSVPKTISVGYSSQKFSFKQFLSTAKNIVIISGDDISNESGVPTYSPKDYWRRYPVSSLGTSDAFLTFPSLIWEFYHHRRDLVSQVEPTEALANKGSPNVNETNSDIPEELLPHCNKSNCSGLLRPDIVWFGEPMEPSVLAKAEQAILTCEVCLVVGSAGRLFPTALYASEAKDSGAIVAEFNNIPSNNLEFHYYFEGPFSKTISQALDF